MHSGRRYNIKEFLLWTRTSIYKLFIIALVPTLLYQVLGWKWISIPWLPVALVGTAAAFIAGFKNTQTYNRMWEARMIWGGIVNSSRTWGIMVKDFIRSSTTESEKRLHQELIYRHFAWLTALRFQLRESKEWENIKSKSYNREYKRLYQTPEWESKLDDELIPYLTDDEKKYILSKQNKATQLIANQSKRLKELNKDRQLENLHYVEMQNLLKELYEHQGKSERIKNFPYPRQFASINLFFIQLLIYILPLGMLNEFNSLGQYGAWFTIPFSVIVGWVFTSLEQIGESTENPFEGGPNDIPITALSKTIEIDLRDMLDEPNLPVPAQPVNKILM
ncbi:bestrophin family protein [Chondrinema litorale]|uniref:bestrophin family protein n=1 Tax=Chondrinema litorale TaxID=2994555 RepID=UPI0025437922|nr:bestrophin family ion channel [Chondrinema litorale]UZR98299.1 bestrophin family ion channel [Chondrinema litorale]